MPPPPPSQRPPWVLGGVSEREMRSRSLARSLAPQNAVIKQPGIVRVCVRASCVCVCLVRVPFTRVYPAGLTQARRAGDPPTLSNRLKISHPSLTHSLLPHSLSDRSLFLLHFVTSGLAIKISRPPPSPSSSKVRAGV